MSFMLQQPIDFPAHNVEVDRVWKAFNAGKPYRVPVSVIGSITNYPLNPVLNTRGWSFQQFFEDPEIQIQAQLAHQKWTRFNVYCDQEMGLPENGWSLTVNFQNSYEAGWVGCPLRYFAGQVPDTEEMLHEEKEKLYDLPRLLPVDHGLLGRGLAFYDYMHEACKHLEYEGRPVNPPARMPGEGTDGPLDLAYKLRGAGNLLIDMLTDEDYYHDLMTYITDNVIHRMKRLREMRWARFPDSPDAGVYRSPNYYFADDAIALLSLEHYREFVYPYHKRFFDEFSDGAGASVHLCGDATRHFKFIHEALGVTAFDTGFPVDHGWLRRELGPDVQINGGPTVMVIKDGTPSDIESEVRRICASGVMDGGKFVMIAANNMAPRTPVENIATLYEATKQYGQYAWQ
ncbi:MAG: uroporphyrinogen decarboxylase family protein [Armatimonadota bacterium]